MFTSTSYPSTGLYSQGVSASLIHCSVETSVQGLEAVIQLGMLFQNTSPHDMQDATFHCKLDCEESAMTSFSCRVERTLTHNLAARFERRMMKRAVKEGSVFQCAVGRVPSGSDAVIFIRCVSLTPVFSVLGLD